MIVKGVSMPRSIKTGHRRCCAPCVSVLGLLLIVWGPVPLAGRFQTMLMDLFSQGSKWAALVALRWRGAIEGPQWWLLVVLALALM